VAGPTGYAASPPSEVQAQVVCGAAPGTVVGPGRAWGHVEPAHQYYQGPTYNYDPQWYAQRHLSCPTLYQAYPYDPAGVCANEHYYMPDDGLYYCYTPDPVAENSSLQGRCAGQAYLYICPEDMGR
jgi:hypothetical protein